MSEPENPKEKADTQPGSEEKAINRRDFFNEITSGALGIAALGAAVVTVQYLSPNVLFEPPTSFRVGSPDNYPLDSVTMIEDQQVYVVRTAQGFFAESAVCTHLGCITKWNPEANLIQCPCHGSMFQKDGTVAHGPAPRPLPHFLVRLMPDGTLLVDKLESVPQTQVTRI
jgi:cytochrome b6-f complex iron-sulfur subunit